MWESETTAKVLSTWGAGRSTGLRLTSSLRAGSLSEVASFDGVFGTSSLAPPNLVAAAASSSLLHHHLAGQGWARSDTSVRAAAGLTPCQSTGWASDSALACRPTPPVLSGSRSVSVTSAGGVGGGSATAAWSADAAALTALSAANFASGQVAAGTPPALLAALSASPGLAPVRSLSSASRLLGSAAGLTAWASASSVWCRQAGGSPGGSGRVVISAGAGAPGTLSEAASLDAAAVSSLAQPNARQAGGAEAALELWAASLGGPGSAGARLGGSGAESSAWASDTSLRARAPMGLGPGLPAALTAGVAVGTAPSAFSFDRPFALPALQAATARNVSGAWCAVAGGACACRGVALFALLNSTGGEAAAADSESSVACSGSAFSAALTDPSAMAACFCFNRPFSGGSVVTLTGGNFGLMDPSPVSRTVAGTRAEVSLWLSQTSLISRLPACTDCGLQSQNTTLSVSLAGYSEANFSVRVPFEFAISPREYCPGFWSASDSFTLEAASGQVCRRGYAAGDSVSWTLVACGGGSAISCNASEEVWLVADAALEGTGVRRMGQAVLSFSEFSVGASGVLRVYSCHDAGCSSPWDRAGELSGSALPAVVRGNPYLKLVWSSSAAAASASSGWSAYWSAALGRTFRLFEPSGGLNFTAATAACQGLQLDGGGYSLASVASADERAAVAALGNVTAWLGLYRADGGAFGWADGSPFGGAAYAGWAAGQPGSDPQEACGVSLAGSGEWQALDCTRGFAYVCSKK